MEKNHGKGLILVVSGPSGVGKGTLLSHILKLNDNMVHSVSATTRKPREGELDGKNYFFKTREEFELMIRQNELVEWVEYCENFYGTPKSFIDKTINEGNNIVLEIEVEGAENIKKIYPESISIFIMPPCFDDIRKRLIGRGTESVQSIEKRLIRAREEIKQAVHYDYMIINDQIEIACNDFISLLKSERMRIDRNKEFISNFICRQDEMG